MILSENRLSIALIDTSGETNSSLFKKDKVKMDNMTPHSASFTNTSQLIYLHLQDLPFGPVYLGLN